MSDIIKTFPTVVVSRDNNVAIITLNRPEVFNALSPELVVDLNLALAITVNDRTIRAVVINGAGPSFCAGGDVEKDVAHVAGMKPFDYKDYVKGFSDITTAITLLEKPVIAAMKGYAVGGGFDIAMACDIRIAAQGAKMGNAYIRMGILPEMGGIYFLPRLTSMGNAKLLLFTGEFIPADEAYRMGLVQKVVPEAELDAAVMKLARQLADGPTKAIATTKMALNKSTNLDLSASIEQCQALALGLFQTEDHKEALSAFLAKRKAVFKGK